MLVQNFGRAVFSSWGPGYYDPRYNIDGINDPVVLPPAFGLAGVAAETYTGDGQMVVEVNDPAVEARFRQGRLEIRDSGGKLLYTLQPAERNKKLPAGKYQVHVVGADGLTLSTDEFTDPNLVGRGVTYPDWELAVQFNRRF